MDIELAPGWRLLSDGKQFIVRHTNTVRATRDYKDKSGVIVTRKGDPMESVDERYFYFLSGVLKFMAEHELRQPDALEDAVSRLRKIEGMVDRLAAIGAPRLLQEMT